MEQGSLPERYLSRSVIKHIRRLNPKLSVSAAVGNDYANLHGSVSADGIGDTPWIAWVKAMNNFACSGGQVEGARLTMLLPGNVKLYGRFQFLCRSKGHTDLRWSHPGV